MSLLKQVTKGRIQKPYCLIVYGPPGVGKTTFAADFPKPIFLGAEDGTSTLDVHRLPQPQSVHDVFAAVKELTTEAHDYKTLVIDSLDWIEPLVNAEVCKKAGVSNIEEIGYGKGHVAALKIWQEMIQYLTALREKRAMHLVMIAHAHIKTISDPKEQKSFDRYTLKLHEKASALFSEFVDSILFATYEVFVRTENGKNKAISSGARVLFCEWRAHVLAKNRYGLGFQIPLSFEAFDTGVKSGAPDDPAVLKSQISELLKKVQNEELKTKATESVKTADSAMKLAKILNRLEAVVQNQTN